MTLTRRAFGLALLAAAACRAAAGGPPDLVVDRTTCSHCGMLVSEPIYAAAYGDAIAAPRVFDDIGCLVAAARREPATAGLQFWFHDADDGAWIDGGAAAFVTAPSLRTPMGGGIVAYRDPAAAAAAATRWSGRVIPSLPALLAAGGGRS